MIGLVDGNNFYVSCERIFDPLLEGKPVAVLSNNDGCVISRSQECKALGIAMGTPFFQLRPLLAHSGLIVRSSNYELYGDISRRVIATLGEFAPEVEQYSIDEAFIRLTPPAGMELLEYGVRIRQTILKWIGIPCGIGFAPSRTLAKIANHIGKKLPSGVFVMPDDPRPVLETLPVGEVWGVGRRLAPKLAALGIRTAWQLAAADEALLRRKFNITLAKTARELRGEPLFEQDNPEELSKSISCSRSFGYPVVEFEELAEAVAHYTARAAEKLRRQHLHRVLSGIYPRRAAGRFLRDDCRVCDSDLRHVGDAPGDPAETARNLSGGAAVQESRGALFRPRTRRFPAARPLCGPRRRRQGGSTLGGDG